MRFHFATLFFASLVATAFGKRGCGAPDPSDELRAQAARFAAEAREGTVRISQEAITVDTWFHVVSSGSSISQGNVPDSQLQAQLNVLNEDFASAGITFRLAGTTRTVNSQWAMDRNEVAMKTALRKGDYKTLNVYFQQLRTGLLGYCYFPVQNPDSTDILYDGCSVLYSSVPGGTIANYNQGRTATHEVGHWFGLFHTFQGGCSNSGDQIADTPAERTSTSGCPVGKDTCTGSSWPGVDPIHNFMDYSYDACMYEFTLGQATRIQQFWSYRNSSSIPAMTFIGHAAR
ncbi:extracellular metalloprotease [Kalaharituber pfeilii]|nr:extracellular metalloprotease [Kalaharituber pfeilii]